MKTNNQALFGRVELISWLAVALFTGVCIDLCQAEEPVATGIETRVPWTTSRIKGTPDPPNKYRTIVAYRHLKFENPIAGCRLPGTSQLLIAEQSGKLWLVDQNRETKQRKLLLDMGTTVYGVAAHPQYADNGLIYVMSIATATDPAPRPAGEGSWVSSFKCVAGVADQQSREEIIKWPAGGHNAGCLAFGHDGYLYISCGDGSGIADERHTGQDVSDLLASILRIDVDHRDSPKAYGIPADNPFRGLPGAREEIYSYGHRQVWKFSFDSATGSLWAGDIGQDLWEMVYRVKKGGNYGWSVREGSHPFRPERKHGPASFEKPIVEHSHNDFRSLTGGYVYHGTRLADLQGHYVYGDFDTGKIWSFKYKSGKVVEHGERADSAIRLVSFLEDQDGELLLIDYASGRLFELALAHLEETDPAAFPRLLSQTGLFASTQEHTPAAGVIPYSVNSALWSDHATKLRFLAIPGNGQIDFDDVIYPENPPAAPATWRFPDGTVAVKTFAVELEKGNPASLRRLETRLLHHKRMDGDDNGYGAQVWRGYTYVWNDQQTDAVLLDKAGRDIEFKVKDPLVQGGEYVQKWHFPSRAECTLCHTMASRYILGINTHQLNRLHDYAKRQANQLDTFNHIGLFSTPLEKPARQLERVVDYHDQSESVNRRARSYLFSNCAHCHRKWGGGNAAFSLLPNKTLAETATLSVTPAHGSFKLTEPALLVPGSPVRSLLYHRMTILELGRMPHVGSSMRDEYALKLIEQWIREMPPDGYSETNGIVGGMDE